MEWATPPALLGKFSGDMEVATENALAVWPSDDRVGTADGVVFLAHGPAPDAGRKESKRSLIWKSWSLEKPFINLSSIAAVVRHVFASKWVVAGIRINKIRSDCMPTNQKVGSSTLSGRTTF